MGRHKLTTCKHCGAQIAKAAPTCPHCGGKNKSRHPIRRLLLFVILIILIGCLVKSGFMEQFDSYLPMPAFHNIRTLLQSAREMPSPQPTASDKTPAPSPKPTATNVPDTATTEPSPTPTPEPIATSSPDQSSIDPAFKAAVDSYETFFNDYVRFLKKYTDSNFPLTMMADYLKFIADYAEMMEAFDALGDSEMTAAEAKYYFDAMARIQANLYEAAIVMGD